MTRIDPDAAKRAQRQELDALRSGRSPQEVMDGLEAYAGATWELIAGKLCIRLAGDRCEDPEHPVTMRVPTRLVGCECDLHEEGVCWGHTGMTYSRALIPGPRRRRQRRKWAASAAICDACYPHWERAHLREWGAVAEETEQASAATPGQSGAGAGDVNGLLAKIAGDLGEV